MRFHIRIVSVFTFVFGLFHNFDNFHKKTWLWLNHSFILDNWRLSQRLLAAGLLLAMLLPMMFIGHTNTVSANNFPVNPVIEIPPILLAPPQPFHLAGNNLHLTGNIDHLSGQNSAFLLVFGVWDKISSLFSSSSDSSNKSEISENSVNSATSENSANSKTLLPTPTTADLSRARLSPINQTGGTSLYSRNFGWGTGLAGLSGRGLDAGFGISYNSLIWTKSGSDIVFNPNNDNVTPGFRFGFPVIEPSYTDPLTSQTTHLMVTPSGGRVEFRLLSGSSDTFETADSSYTQLKVIDSNTLVIFGTDGTQAVYTLKNGAFRCASIKDSNGNYITVNHDTNGLLQSVIDTLGREVDVSYDSGGQPTSITQAWAAGTHTYASFTYTTTTVNTSFSGLTQVGLTNNTSIKVLQKITFADSSYVTFDYNTYGQVWKISNYAADAHLLNYSAINLDSFSSAQTDCPRFSEFHNWIENFNLNSSNVAQEVVIPVSYQESQSFTLPDSSTATGTLLQVTAPDGTVSKTYVGSSSSGWMEAVPVVTEDWVYESSSWVKKRWSYTAYTQDNTSLGYILNPRVVESKIGDSSNVKRTTLDYYLQSGSSTVALYGLVKDVIQYDSNGTSQLKKSHTEYNLDSNYTSRRIIGLPAESTLYDGSNNLMSKVTYGYDEGNFSGTGQSVSAVNHDSTNYGTGFSYRGNMTSTSRWDVTAPTNSSLAVTNLVKYNITGNPISKIDPLNRTISISYTDNYDDSTNHNTYAFPTTLTDPASNSSTVKYRLETGANVYAESPAPAGQSYGKKTSRTYDSIGRLQQETIVNTGAYTRYEYPTNGVQAKVYSTIVDVNSNGADSNDEVLSESFTDGAGRVRQSKTEHPGSSGGWSATLTEYDIMGRVKRSSVPTEVNSSWAASGDDSTRGFVWNALEYDWKGRVIRQINTDGSDKLISYDGCGCAGGQVTTIQSELVPRDDSPSTNARRTQKVYEDILGRAYKTETLNWGGSVYATQKSFFNGRDQVTTKRDYAGSDSSSTYQDTVMTYDGHGRLYSQHRPEQNTSTATVYNYYADDRIQQVVDARGATVNYTYNSRGLVTEVSTTSPNTTTIPVTPTVTYTYDNLGNRTQMTDGMGTQTYEYNQLSQITAETRSFTDSLSSAPLSGNSFKLEYGYTLSGQLKYYKDPFGQQINYDLDKTGRLSAVVGSTSFGGITTYANNSQYRAWGELKSLSYGDGAQMNLTFNNRLQAASYSLSVTSNSIMSRNYQYYADGGFKYMEDSLNPKFDRFQSYDHLGRVVEGKSGAEARGQTAATPLSESLPYRQSYQYNAFGQLVIRNNLHWGRSEWDENFNLTYFHTNNRDSQWTYDADGNAVSRGTFFWDTETATFDAVGQITKLTSTFRSTYPHTTPLTEESVTQDQKSETYRYYDGNGAELKRIQKSCLKNATLIAACTLTEEPPRYFIASSVFAKEIISEVNSHGKKLKTFVKAAGTNLAWQSMIHGEDGDNYYNPPLEAVYFERTDPSGMSRRVNNTLGPSVPATEEDPVENDPLGNNAGTENPYNEEQLAPEGDGACKNCNFTGLAEVEDTDPIRINGQRAKCTDNGLSVPCAQIRREMESGRVGGALGLAEAAAKRSTELVGYSIKTRPLTRVNNTPPHFSSPNHPPSPYPIAADGETPIMGTLSVVTPIYNSNWAVNWSMLPNEQKKAWQQTDPTKKNPRQGLVFEETKTKAVLDRQKLITCLNDLFGVTPEVRTANSEEGFQDESGIVLSQDKYQRFSGDFSGTSEASKRDIRININGSYNSLALKQWSTGSDKPQQSSTTNGATPPRKEYQGTVFISADIRNENFALAVAIHEIGNALAILTMLKPKAQDPLLYRWDNDAGNALEECVYGGKVSPNGNLYKITEKKK